MLLPSKPDITKIRSERTQLSNKLMGMLADKPNVYFNGNVVSWNLEGSCQTDKTLKRDSTVGIIKPGKFIFPTEHREELTVLYGSLRVGTGDAKTDKYNPLEMISVPAGTTLTIEADSPVTYLCQYK